MRTSTNSGTRKIYTKSFKASSKFVVFDQEFIPYSLFKLTDSGEDALQEAKDKFGKPTIAAQYDKLLSKFYKQHSLKRDIDHIVDSISYLTIPDEVIQSSANAIQKVSASDFYASDAVNKLAQYHSRPYHAKEDHLREIGLAISDHILQPTNYWLSLIEITGFENTPERYWQVAGVFKKRIWGKLQRKDHLDKKVFFCLGIDLERKILFYGLECLRTGTSKLSTEQIYKFDHFTKGSSVLEEIDLGQISQYNWERLIRQSQKFLNKMVPLYDQVVDYIWNDTVDVRSIDNRLIPMTAHKPSPSDESIDINKKSVSLAIDLVIDHEKAFLKYKGKNKLSKKVREVGHSNNHYDVASYHLDGTDKLIKIISSKSSSVLGATISQSSIEASIDNQQKSYLYIVCNISNKRKSGLLYISKGRFDKVFKTAPERYKVLS